MNHVALFDFAETQQVARAVGFNPLNGLARECLEDSRNVAWDMPDGLPESLKFQAEYYIAVGLFIWQTYGDNGLPVPAAVNDWYELNTALTAEETFFAQPVGV